MECTKTHCWKTHRAKYRSGESVVPPVFPAPIDLKLGIRYVHILITPYYLTQFGNIMRTALGLFSWNASQIPDASAAGKIHFGENPLHLYYCIVMYICTYLECVFACNVQ